MSGSRLGGGPAGGTLQLIAALWGRTAGTVRGTPRLLALSIVLGIALWVFVTEDENPSVTGILPNQIPVTFVNVADQLAVANDLGSVDLRIEASEDRWEGLSAANFEATVDLAGLTAREQSVPVRAEVIGTRGVRILAVEPPTISVNLEQVVSRIIPVQPRLLGSPPSGFEIVQTVPERLTVEISGPESLVELAEHAVAEINVTGLTVGIQRVAELAPRGASGGRIRGLSIEPPSVRVAVDVRKSTVSKTVPLSVELLGEPAAGYRVAGVDVRPSVARIEGALDVLQTLDELPLGLVRLDGADGDIELSLVATVPEGRDGVRRLAGPRGHRHRARAGLHRAHRGPGCGWRSGRHGRRLRRPGGDGDPRWPVARAQRDRGWRRACGGGCRSTRRRHDRVCRGRDRRPSQRDRPRMATGAALRYAHRVANKG